MTGVNATMIFTLFGGLAMFVYGMQQMGEGLQKVAGDKLKSIHQMLTGNPLLGVLVGKIMSQEDAMDVLEEFRARRSMRLD